MHRSNAVSDSAEAEVYLQAVRGLLHPDESAATFPERLQESGWYDLAAEEPATAVGLLFEEQGRDAVATTALDAEIARSISLDLGTTTAIAHPRGDFPDFGAAGDSVRVDAILLAGSDRAERVAVPTATCVVTGRLSSLDVAPISGLDPALGLLSARGTLACETVHQLDHRALLTAARRALSHELIGVAEAMLAMSVKQVSDRQQFGRPIAAFQTVKHRLAEAKVSVDGARAAALAAWRVRDDVTADVAKALAGKAALVTAKHCQQVSGAIGFSMEYGLHTYVQRAYVLDRLYGSASFLQDALGSDLIRNRAVPRLATPWRPAP
jgi:hypothetical protein